MAEIKIRNTLTDKKVGLVQKTLGPNVYGNLFKEGVDENITAYIDYEMLQAINHQTKTKVAILVEPRTVQQNLYDWIEKNYSMFDMVMSHDKALCSVVANAKYYPVWPIIKIKEQNRKVYQKTKNVSAIFSKRRMTEGHRLRHMVAKLFGKRIDLYGTGYNPIDDKVLGTADYRYQVVIENIKEGYVSEKANDCFACGTVPIYWGSENSNIVDFYDKRGIIFFKNLNELKHVFTNIISEEDYKKRKKFIEINFDKTKNLSLDKIYYDYGLKTFLD